METTVDNGTMTSMTDYFAEIITRYCRLVIIDHVMIVRTETISRNRYSCFTLLPKILVFYVERTFCEFCPKRTQTT